VKLLGGAIISIALVVRGPDQPSSCDGSPGTPPPPPELKGAATPVPHLKRLRYHIDATGGNGMIAIVNEDRYAWNDVHVEIGDGDATFQCPALPTVSSGHNLRIQGGLCRSSNGHVPMQVCVVHVVAKEGRITCGLEPCVPAQ
jgi:hypothetical protein